MTRIILYIIGVIFVILILLKVLGLLWESALLVNWAGVVDAHRGDGKRFVVRADELLAAFLELQAAIRAAESNSSRVNDDRRTPWKGGGRDR